MDRIRVLVVDDSAVMRKFLSDELSKSPRIEVVGTALDPYIAADKINKLRPDVLTLDIEMPRMDGLTFLSKLMIAGPMPVIMVSSFTERGARATIRALELGAMDFITKPSMDDREGMSQFVESLTEKIFAASSAHVRRKPVAEEKKPPRPGPPAQGPLQTIHIEKKYSADVILSKKDPQAIRAHSEKVIAIGASTGGTEVIDAILSALPPTLPGIVITQHMPEKFTEAFANRVNEKAEIAVKEAANGDRLYKGMAFVAPGGKHMLLHADAGGYRIEINDGPPVNRHKPSVDVLFRSVSQAAGKSAMGILCTGMGNDGAAGLLEMKDTGAMTVAQDEASSVVFGMPNEAIKLDAAQKVLNIKGIIELILGFND